MSKKSFSGTSSSKETEKESSFIESFLPSQKTNEITNASRVKPLKENDEKVTRQTFMIKETTLNKMKDFVHTKRKNEDYNYSQKQALEEALHLLFDTIKIEKRDK
jgi:hypothetical protein